MNALLAEYGCSDSEEDTQNASKYDVQSNIPTKSESVPIVSTSEASVVASYPLLDSFPEESFSSSSNSSTNISDAFTNYVDMSSSGSFDVAESIKSKKEFGNPSLLSQVVDHFHINPFGSNYPTDLFDPFAYDQSDYLDQIPYTMSSNNSLTDPGYHNGTSQPANVTILLSDRNLNHNINSTTEMNIPIFSRDPQRKSRWDSSAA